MKKILGLAIIICGLAFSAGAVPLKGDRISCLTEDLFYQLRTAGEREDEKAWAYLMKNGCVILRVPTVRAYVEERARILWVIVFIYLEKFPFLS